MVDESMLHDLALLYAVFACGAVADLTQPAINPEAERYNHLARAAMGLRSLLDYGSFAACQSLIWMGSYEMYSGRKTSQESSWKLISIAMTLASSVSFRTSGASFLANLLLRLGFIVNLLDGTWMQKQSSIVVEYSGS